MQACHTLGLACFITSFGSFEGHDYKGIAFASPTCVAEENKGGESSSLCTLALIQRWLRAQMTWFLGHERPF